MIETGAYCSERKHSMPSVFIVVLNWNGWKDTIECLESIQQLDYDNYRIVVVDNGSTDDSWSRLQAWARGESHVSGRYTQCRAEDKPVTTVAYDRSTAEGGGVLEKERLLETLPSAKRAVLVKSLENLGFAGGNNVAVRYALKRGADYIWLLNNDTVIVRDTLSKLILFLEDNRSYQGATGQIRYYDQPDHVWNCGGYLKWYGVQRYNHADADIARVPQSGFERISFVTGCAPLFRSQLFRTAGLLSDRYFWGTEDIEFSQRLRNAGQAIACVYGSVVYHKVSRSIAEDPREMKIGMIYYHYLGVFINMRYYWPRHIWHLWRILYVVYIVYLVVTKYKYTFKMAEILVRALLHDSVLLDRIDRATFEDAREEKFVKRYEKVLSPKI
jgi:GT2 family glycosyltransferase